MSNPIRYGSPARSGTYRCVDCGHQLRVNDVTSMPPCPRSSEVEHEAHAWRRHGHGGLVALSLVVAGLGVAALVHARGSRRIAEETRELAQELASRGAALSERGLAEARRGLDELGRRVDALTR